MYGWFHRKLRILGDGDQIRVPPRRLIRRYLLHGNLFLRIALPCQLRHGHAINIDMSFFITFGWTRGYLSEEERDEYHRLSHSVGLSMDHELFTREMIAKATEAIL